MGTFSEFCAVRGNLRARRLNYSKTRTENEEINEDGVRNWCKVEGRGRTVGKLFSDPVKV